MPLSVLLAEFERRNENGGGVAVGAGARSVPHQRVHRLQRAQLCPAARGVPAHGVMHDRTPPALGGGTDHPAGSRPRRMTWQTTRRHAGQIHALDGRQLPIGHPDRVLGRLDSVLLVKRWYSRSALFGLWG